MDDLVWGISLGALTGVFLTVVLVTVTNEGWPVSKREVYERGYMVQCIGKSGYYWECE